MEYEKLTLIKDFKDEIFYNIAYAQAQNLNYEEAINNYSKSIKYDQNDDYTYLNRGNAKFNKNDYLGLVKSFLNHYQLIKILYSI